MGKSIVLISHQLDFSRPLRDQAVVASSSQRYRSAFVLFCKFVKFHYRVDVMKVGVGRMDVYLEAFVEACFKKFEKETIPIVC